MVIIASCRELDKKVLKDVISSLNLLFGVVASKLELFTFWEVRELAREFQSRVEITRVGFRTKWTIFHFYWDAILFYKDFPFLVQIGFGLLG